MKFLGFENFIKGNGIWIIVGVLGAALIVSLVFLVINVVRLKKQKNAEVVQEEKVEEKQEEVKEESVVEEKPEEKVEEKKAQPSKKTTPKKVVQQEKKEAVKEPVKKEEKTEEPKAEQKAEVKQEKKATYGVTYDKENRQWVVKKTGATRASKRCTTKAEALEYAEKLSEASGANLRVHKKDGKFQKR